MIITQINYIKTLIFLFIESNNFLLSIIDFNYAPYVTVELKVVGLMKLVENILIRYNDIKDESEGNWYDQDIKDYHFKLLKEGKNYCLRRQAMIELKYAAFHIDDVFGFICAIFGK